MFQHWNNELPTILVVEDDPVDVWLLQNSLAAAGVDHPIVVCADGREAVSWLAQVMKNKDAVPSQIPRLMLVDLRLPHLDGFTVITLVRAQRLFTSMTIVAVSGTQDPDDVKRAFAAGADHFIAKPADANTVRQLLDDTGFSNGYASSSRVG